MKELKEWLKGFYEVASYHNGDYSEGMYRVLNGLRSQLEYFERVETERKKDLIFALQDLVKFCEENNVGAELELAKEVLSGEK